MMVVTNTKDGWSSCPPQGSIRGLEPGVSGYSTLFRDYILSLLILYDLEPAPLPITSVPPHTSPIPQSRGTKMPKSEPKILALEFLEEGMFACEPYLHENIQAHPTAVVKTYLPHPVCLPR